MYYELIVLGLVCFMGPWLARLAGYETGRKPFDLVGVAGIFFLLTTAFGLGMNMIDLLAGIGKICMIGSFVLGWVTLAVGAVWGAIEVFAETDKEMAHQKA